MTILLSPSLGLHTFTDLMETTQSPEHFHFLQGGLNVNTQTSRGFVKIWSRRMYMDFGMSIVLGNRVRFILPCP